MSASWINKKILFESFESFDILELQKLDFEFFWKPLISLFDKYSLKTLFHFISIFRIPVPNLNWGYLMVERKYTCKLGAVVGTDASDCEVLGSIPLSTNYLFQDNYLLSWIFHFSSLKLNCDWWQVMFATCHSASQGSNHGVALSVDSNWMIKEWTNQSSTKQGHHIGCSYAIPTKILCFTS